MKLTKTDFIQYLNCPESLWLQKNRPENCIRGEMSLFLEKLISEGYEVEKIAMNLFPDGFEFSLDHPPYSSVDVLSETSEVFFQMPVISSDGAFARIDILKRLSDGTWHLYEVKSSTSVKEEKKHNHLKDVCFQKYVLEKAGFIISKCSIIHLNKEYVKNGNIVPSQILKIEDVTEKIDHLFSDIVVNIENALQFIQKENISDFCSCRYKTRANHCDNFNYFNPETPEFSIYQLKRISEGKIYELLEQNILEIPEVPLGFKLTKPQQLQVKANITEQPEIDSAAIKRQLESLEYPLHFIDYETYPTAVPILDGMKPHQHLVFQVSVHTLKEDGTLTHFEYLSDSLCLPENLLSALKEFTGEEGSFISWNETFEKQRNEEMKQQFPKYADYLTYVNYHMFDLMKVFKENYVDHRFKGYESIKKVLPVICPQFSYSDLAIQEGTMALDTWGRMITDPNFPDDIEETKLNLLAYCKLDTLAMVEIFKYLKQLPGVA